MPNIGNILQNSTLSKNNGGNGSDYEVNEEVIVFSALKQINYLLGMETGEVDHKDQPPNRKYNISLNYFFNPTEYTPKKLMILTTYQKEIE